MDHKRGEIYFIGERDANAFSDFVKIGLVREREGRDSNDRIKEHQTGNPRPLHLHHVVPTVLVSIVENTLHRENAGQRVLGEWFRMPQDALDRAVARCVELATTYAGHVPTLESAEALESVVSNGTVAPATEEARFWHAKYVQADAASKLIGSAKEAFKGLVRKLYESGVDISAVGTIKEQPGVKRFSKSKFREQYPELWAQFSETSSKIVARFSVLGDKDATDEEPALDDARALLSAATVANESSVDYTDALLRMHALYLGLLGQESLHDEQKFLATAHLKTLCGDNESIEGVCRWKRTLDESIELDADALRFAHPAEYESCVTVGEPSASVRINRSAGGAPLPLD
jgi:hypothetical protein